MNNQNQKRFSFTLSGLLVLLLITYALGAVYFFLNLFNKQSIQMELSTTGSLVFALVFLFGAISTWMITSRKRIGVYGLLLTWIITAFLNLIFPSPVSYAALFAGVLIVVLFIFSIRPVWKSLT